MKISYATWLGSDGLKSYIVANKLDLFRNDEGGAWYVFANSNNNVLHELRIFKDGGSDQTDFESNFASLHRDAARATQQHPFASKELPNGKKLYKRLIGVAESLTAGANTIIWVQSDFPWTKFVGLEIIGAELGDTCDLYVLDTSTGTYSGVPNLTLNKFAFTANIAPGFYKRVSEYDADLFQNLQIKIEYNSVSAKTLYVNFDLNEVK